MKQLILAAMAACVLPLSSCSKDFDNSTVTQFDLSRYLGVWYEVARYNHSFEKGMDNTMAEYILQDDGKVFVLNTGWKNGKFEVAEGKAKYKDPEGNPGALKVSFFLFFYSEYNVMMVDGPSSLISGLLAIIARMRRPVLSLSSRSSGN